MKKSNNPDWTIATAPCPFENDEFSKIWETLLGMPKWKKKPLSAIQLACNRLKRFDINFAAILVENAIEGNYQGVVFTNSELQYESWKRLKQYNGNKFNGSNKQPVPEARPASSFGDL